jgi:hypothetical protein
VTKIITAKQKQPKKHINTKTRKHKTKEMADIRADLERIIQLVNSGDVESLKKEDFDQFQYQGFDPYKIIESLMKVKTSKTVTDEDFKTDVYTMVAIGVIKGSVNSRNINKMSDAGKVGVQGIITKYGILMGGGKSQPAHVVTFPRMMATFPDITIRMTKVIGVKEFRGGPMESTRLPWYLQVQVFPAIIPRKTDQDIKTMLLAASLCYSIDQSIQISQLKNPDLKKLAGDQFNFTNIGHNSPVPAESVRESVFKSLSVHNDYAKISSVLSDYKREIDPSFTIMSEEQFKSKLT